MIKRFVIDYPELAGQTRRKAYVYLPTSYMAEKKKRFPVLYMFDGQNVFFDEDATYGRSWRLGEYLDYTDTPLIVAAVECSSDPEGGRLSEYSPFDFSDQKYGSFTGLGFETMRWFAETFKPMIDRRYRTLSDREHTFIAGSSMGGLMSIYALLRFNSTYSRAAALSPSIWVSEELDELIAKAEPDKSTTLYMDYGSNELGNHRGMMRRYCQISEKLMKKGIFVTSRIVPYGNHNEESWDNQTPFFIHTLMYGII